MTSKTKSENVRAVVEWRRRARDRLIAAFGRKCGICGYHRFPGNLALHHIDPSKKDFSFGAFQSKAWTKIVDEARKCFLLCHNCHGEVHAGLALVDGCPRFNETLAEYRIRVLRICESCGRPIDGPGKRYCSRLCKAKEETAERPPGADLIAFLRTHTQMETAENYGVSPPTIKKWITVLGLDLSDFDKRRSGARSTDLNLRPAG